MDAAFFVVFALFLLAMVGLAFMAVRWAVRQDRTARSTRTPAPPTDAAASGPAASGPAASGPAGTAPAPGPRRRR